MGSFSIWHWLIVLAVLAVYGVPLWVIVRKAGFHPALSVLWIIPVLNVVMLWVFAFSRWPALPRKDA